jgi:lipoprotein-anchoring transpeptidase ErfK/SrfK
MAGIRAVMVVIAATALAACGTEKNNRLATDTVVVHDTTVMMDTTRMAAADSSATGITLPVLDAFFADSSFAAQLRTGLGLTETQIDSLRHAAREETGKLTETGDDRSAAAARDLAMRTITGIIGPEKARELAGLVGRQWSGGADTASGFSATGSGVPTDSRIVVNAPANRMDVFENGHLVRSYTVAIGYPEFPLPSGLRTAKSIIFNPTWTPPDEPWVESSKKVSVGKTIAAGSSLNPLGIAKIPIGLPSLIHGGKSQAQLGAFGSHGCVGLTDRGMREFVMEMAKLGGTPLTDSMINAYGKKRSKTETIDLARPVPVELRYQTIVATDGRLHIYRDVYDRNTNNEENLRAVLATYSVTMDQLTDAERAQVMAGLHDMARDAAGKLDTAAIDTTAVKGKAAPKPSARVTRTIKGKKEIVVDIAALKGKGYPAPMDAAPALPKEIVRR